MDLFSKIKILSDAAKYDVSCSSSGSNRKNTKDGIGCAESSGICHSWSDDGRCISLLKILFTNICSYNCTYCVNKSTNDIPRAIFTPRELADLTINFYRRNYIEGLFLSSAVYKSPDYTMELMIKTISVLRNEYKFNGYIHMKAIPGADLKLINIAGRLVDRMSVNIELPSERSLKILAPQKTKKNILTPMTYIKNKLAVIKEEKQKYKYTQDFVPAGQSTQLIVGATSENDLKILNLSESLYQTYKLKRVYYSAYVPVLNHPDLPDIKYPPLLREHRLYQADWLLRFYKFNASEILNDRNPNFDLHIDPKCNWALNNLDKFPVEINKADYETLLRIPGVGAKSAQRIIKSRKAVSLDYETLKKIGVVLKRAKYFITCKGKYYGGLKIKEELLRPHLASLDDTTSYEQISIFDLLSNHKGKNISLLTNIR